MRFTYKFGVWSRLNGVCTSIQRMTKIIRFNYWRLIKHSSPSMTLNYIKYLSVNEWYWSSYAVRTTKSFTKSPIKAHIFGVNNWTVQQCLMPNVRANMTEHINECLNTTTTGMSHSIESKISCVKVFVACKWIESHTSESGPKNDEFLILSNSLLYFLKWNNRTKINYFNWRRDELST